MIGAMKDGLVPSRIPEPGPEPAPDGAPPPSRARVTVTATPAEPNGGEAPSYGCADATLWLFEAARHVADAIGDRHPFVIDELVPALRDAFEAALRGTTNGVHVTAEGLFAAAAPGDALTWMAARVDGKPVTPRAGCPVELTALWASGCDTLARLARAAGDAPLHDRAAAARETSPPRLPRSFLVRRDGLPLRRDLRGARGRGRLPGRVDPAQRGRRARGGPGVLLRRSGRRRSSIARAGSS